MSEHLSDEQLESYARRAAPPTQMLALDEHLSACEGCRKKINDASSLQSAFRNLRTNLQTAARAAPEHLTFEFLEAYVKNRVDELNREIVESHVELCSHCAKELSDLQAFAAMMDEAPVVTGKEAAQESSAWQKFLAMLGFSSSLRFAGVAAAVLLILSGSLVIILKLNESRRALETAQTNTSEPVGQPPIGQQNQNSNSSIGVKPENNRPELPTNTRRQANSVIAFTLSVIARGDAPTLVIGPDTTSVELRAKVPQGASYGTRLESAGGSRNLGVKKASAAGFVVYRIPVNQLRAGSYALTLFKVPAQDDDDGITYSFDVKR
jgi:predicted anti-sigma-YlaC factor YlaD